MILRLQAQSRKGPVYEIKGEPAAAEAAVDAMTCVTLTRLPIQRLPSQ